MEENKKVLFFLDASKPYNRILRRAVVIGFLSFIVVGIKSLIPQLPEAYMPILVAVLAALEKAIREDYSQ